MTHILAFILGVFLAPLIYYGAAILNMRFQLAKIKKERKNQKRDKDQQ